MSRIQEAGATLPVRWNLAVLYALSLVIALLMVAASVIGILGRSVIYPTDELLRSFVPTDVANLLLGFPTLLGSMWLTRRGRLVGLFLWPGALFFALYNYLNCILAMPLNGAFLLHLTLVMLTLYTLLGLLACTDAPTIQRRLSAAVPQRLTGGILTGLGLLFFLRALGVLIGALASQAAIGQAELALNVADFLVAPCLVIGGVLLWQRKAFGYVVGLGLLFQASMLFVGLILLLLLQPVLTGAPFAPVDVVVVAVLGLICFVPLALFARGVVDAGRSSAI